MAVVTVDQFLAHYGVKGMKWGVRRDRKNQTSNASKDPLEAEISSRIKAGFKTPEQVRDFIKKYHDPDPERLVKIRSISYDGPKAKVEFITYHNTKLPADAWNKLPDSDRFTDHDVTVNDPKHILDFDKDLVEHVSMIDDFLSHYGIKGMKWGVRRSRKELARAEKALDQALKKNSPTDVLSNDQLRQLIDRMNLERQYRTLATETQQQKKGRAFAKKLLADVASSQLTRVAKAGAAVQVEKALLGQGRASAKEIGKRLRSDVYNSAGQKKAQKKKK